MAKETAEPKAPKAVQAAAGETIFEVRFPKDAAPVHVSAVNSREAWAKFCDANKTWPSPKAATVTEIK